MKRHLLLRLAALTTLILTCSLTVAAEEKSPDAGLEAMARLSSMLGRWEGGGWMRQGPGEPHKMSSLETVESMLGGRIIVVEGLHHDVQDPAQVVHHAFGVISWDAENSHYRFQTHLANGRSGDYEMRFEGDDIVWRIPTPRGKVRYTIRIADGEWKEVGEFSADGTTWQQFFAMDLKQVSP